MPVPASINDLATTAIANSPQGTESAKGTIDEYFRAHAGIIASIPVTYAADTGATKLGYKLNAIGAVARLTSNSLADVISSDDFSGMDKTGAAECSTAWNSAFAATRLQGAPANASRPLLIRAGTYKISASITVGTNQRVVFEPGVIIDASGLPDEFTSVFAISNQNSVYLEGNGAVVMGARATAGGAVEGNSCAFFLFGADNVHIKNFQIQDFATDGITVDGDATGSGPCTNVIIEGCTVNNCRRNGLSIISVKGCTVIGGEYSGSNGAPIGPWAGIDVEPNNNCYCEGVLLLNVRTSDNVGSGIQITPGAMAEVGATSTYFDLSIIGGRSVNDGGFAANRGGMLFANAGVHVNKIYGQITIRDFIVDSPVGRGVSFFNWDADKSPLADLESVIVFDPDYASTSPSNYDRVGFNIYCETAHGITNQGNIRLNKCRAIDRRGVARMTWGIAVSADSGKTIKNVTIIDPVSENFVDTAKIDAHLFAATGPGSMSAVDVIYTRPTPLTITADTPFGKYTGKRLNINVASCIQTLPLAANCKDAHYELQVAAGIAGVSVTPSTGDKILYNGLAASAALVIKEGAFLSLRSLGGTSWLAESFNAQV